MLSFNEVFGGGAALRNRSIWMGTDRNVPGVVASQVNPYRLRAGVTSNMMLERVAYNGSLYAGADVSGNLYTSPDLLTLTNRSLGSYKVYSAAAIQGGVFVLYISDGSSQNMAYSANGVTWSYSGNQGNNLSLVEAGGTIYSLLTTGGFTTMNSTKTGAAWTIVNMSAFRAWRGVLYNGTKWLAFAGDGADTSDNGTAFSASASYPAAVAAYFGGAAPNFGFVIGTRFVIVGTGSNGALVSMWSADGTAWNPGCNSTVLPDGQLISLFSDRGCVIGGTFYVKVITVSWASGVALYCTRIASTADGVTWRFSTPFAFTATAPVYAYDVGGMYPIVSSGAVMFNRGFATGGAYETDVTNGKELYYEL